MRSAGRRSSRASSCASSTVLTAFPIRRRSLRQFARRTSTSRCRACSASRTRTTEEVERAVDAERVHGAARAAHILGLRVHCDGARLFNAAVALGVSPSDLVDECDTVTVCVSKGLGAPVGSVVAGDMSRHRRRAAVAQATRWRHAPGGHHRRGRACTRSSTTSTASQTTTPTRSSSPTGSGCPGRHARSPSVPTNLVIIETSGSPARRRGDSRR